MRTDLSLSLSGVAAICIRQRGVWNPKCSYLKNSFVLSLLARFRSSVEVEGHGPGYVNGMCHVAGKICERMPENNTAQTLLGNG